MLLRIALSISSSNHNNVIQGNTTFTIFPSEKTIVDLTDYFVLNKENHKIIEWLGLEVTSRITNFQCPTAGRVASHQKLVNASASSSGFHTYNSFQKIPRISKGKALKVSAPILAEFDFSKLNVSPLCAHTLIKHTYGKQ